jgi:hypothetical protein
MERFVPYPTFARAAVPSRDVLRFDEDPQRNARMTQLLFVGQIPETVDFADPAIPPGFDAKKIRAGIEVAMAKTAERGWQADLCLIPPDEKTAYGVLQKRLAETTYDCVVIGAGVRLPPKSLVLLETVVNAIHKHAPSAAIAFNTRPEDTAEAAARWLNVD